MCKRREPKEETVIVEDIVVEGDGGEGEGETAAVGNALKDDLDVAPAGDLDIEVFEAELEEEEPEELAMEPAVVEVVPIPMSPPKASLLDMFSANLGFVGLASGGAGAVMSASVAASTLSNTAESYAVDDEDEVAEAAPPLPAITQDGSAGAIGDADEGTADVSATDSNEATGNGAADGDQPSEEAPTPASKPAEADAGAWWKDGDDEED